MDFLDELPEHIVFRTGDFNILATHFIEPDITGTSKGSPSGTERFFRTSEIAERE